MIAKVSVLLLTAASSGASLGGCAAGANTGDGTPSTEGSSGSSTSSGAGGGSTSGEILVTGSSGTAASFTSGTASGSGAVAGSSTGAVAPPSTGASESGASAPCGVTAASGAIPLQTNYLSAALCSSAPGGYAYAYADKAGSTACVSESALCGEGTTSVQTASNSATAWGAGIGVNLDQMLGSMVPGACAASGSGVAYAVTGSLPAQGMRLIIDNAGMDYCAPLTAVSGTVPWASFNTACWEPATGIALAGPPAQATHVEFQVNAAATAGTFDFCVTTLEFM